MGAQILKKLSAAALLMFALAFIVSCEGPAGPAGEDGINGVDGVDAEVSCLVCHGDQTIPNVDVQFHQSVHSAGLIAVDYAGGRARCAQCHSHEGFVEFATFGQVGEDIAVPTAWKCSTCHTIHENFDSTDYALRINEPMAFIFDETVTADFGSANICASCHQSRRAEPNVSNPGTEFEITSPHYGPHHGAQSNVLYGAGMAEIAGAATYPEAGTATHFTGASCTSCHMGEYEAGTGGHTFNPAVSSCTSCHAGATDFNINNIMTETETKLNQLRDLLLAQGVIEEAVEEVYELDPETGDIVLVLVSDGFHPVRGTYTMAQSQAFFNWVGLLEDRSFGIHNPAYTKALLDNSIAAID